MRFNSRYDPSKIARFYYKPPYSGLPSYLWSPPSSQLTRIYLDYSVPLPKSVTSQTIYVLLGDTHHLPGLLYHCYKYLLHIHAQAIFAYGKPTHSSILGLCGINVLPCPLDVFLLEAIDDMETYQLPKYDIFTLCSTYSPFQQRRNIAAQLLRNTSLCTAYSFSSKSQYMKHLSTYNYHIIVSNGHQLNPQFFFTIASGTIPIVERGSISPFFKLYPELNKFIFFEYDLAEIRHQLPLIKQNCISAKSIISHNLKLLLHLARTSLGEVWHLNSTHMYPLTLSTIDHTLRLFFLCIYEILQQLNNNLFKSRPITFLSVPVSIVPFLNQLLCDLPMLNMVSHSLPSSISIDMSHHQIQLHLPQSLLIPSTSTRFEQNIQFISQLYQIPASVIYY